MLGKITFRYFGGASVRVSRLVRSLAPPEWTSTSWLRIALALSAMALTGCATRPATPSATQRGAIQSRAAAQFERAIYLKPAITNAVANEAEKFAPLLIIEAAGTNANPAQPDRNLPQKVFFHSGHVLLNDNWHKQKTYWWEYSLRGKGSLAVQGVRITLNSAGSPAIWEALADTSGAQVVFVSQSVEAQALREFGGPQSGRRFAVERALDEAPGTVVARVIEDGPMPMGPIIYLQAGAHDVTTVICRCMDAQARELAGQQEYELLPATKAPAELAKLKKLEHRLRLPKGF